MTYARNSVSVDLRDLFERQQAKGLLRFITCGSVDDGKSTLIGRLLYDSKALFEDQLLAIEHDSRKWGTQGDALDFALLVDGLSAEREQGITIDVAYRFFSTSRRAFIVADTPGHEQYTRNMVTGASTADAAVLLVDARKGILPQTRRHNHLAHLVGIRQIALVVNKMDLIDYDRTVFERIDAEYREFAGRLGLQDVASIPAVALHGDNVVERSAAMPWYLGPTLLQFLETVPLDEQHQQRLPLRVPVQWVNRPSPDFRAFCGLVASGSLRPGQRVRVQPSGRETAIARIVAIDGDRAQAVAGESVTLTLTDEIDVSRGDVLSDADHPAEVADHFEATLVWMADEPLLPGRQYLALIGTRSLGVAATSLKYKVDVNTLEHLAARQLSLNEIGVCNLAFDRAVAYDAYAENRATGSFILIDRVANNTVGAGMLHFALHRSSNLHPQPMEVDKSARARLKDQHPTVLWFTGLSGAGKSTIANRVESKLVALGCHSYLLDGDNLRLGLNRDLGFAAADRVENIRRVAELARLMVDAGLIVLTAFVSPFRAERAMARALMSAGEFVEIHVATPLAVVERRDPKGLYRKARSGELKDFTGIDSPYETPTDPELTLDTTAIQIDEAADVVIDYLRRNGRID